MTLHTRVVVKDPVPVEPLFRFCQRLLGDPERQSWEHRERGFVQTQPDKDPSKGFMRSNSEFANRMGQGLSALMWVEYGADGPLDLDMPERHRWCDEGECDCADYEAHNGGCIEVNFDTAYAYRSANGAGCADLHAWLVLMVCGYLDDVGAKYEWYQEFTGEWFTSPLDVEQLGDPHRGALVHNQQGADGA